MKGDIETDFAGTADFLGAINCVYVVSADGCQVYQSKVFSEALREFRKWVVQLESAMPSMGNTVQIQVLL